MPCHTATITEFLKISPEETLESVIPQLDANNQRIAVILDSDGKMEGYLSYQILLKNLLPVSVTTSDGVDLGVITAAPGIAKRLKSIMPLKATDFMQREFSTLFPQTPTWEAVNIIVKKAQPIFIIDPDTQKLVGILDEKSLFNDLKDMNHET